MKIAVYTIAKNEVSFVNRWFNSAKEADSLHILDTGSMTALSLLLVILVLMYLGGNLIRSVLTPLVILP